MTLNTLSDALVFLRKMNKYWEKNFCQDVWDVSKCGDGDCYVAKWRDLLKEVRDGE